MNFKTEISLARGRTVVPRRRTLPAGRHQGSTSSTFRLVIVADCSPYEAVNRRWPSFSGRRHSYLEWSSTARHVSPSLAIFSSRLKTHLFRRCFPWLHRSLVVPEKWHVITDTLIVLFTYLLTYHHVIFPLKSWHSLALSIYVQTGWLQCYTFNGGLPVVAVHTAIWRPSVSCLLLPSDENETGTSGRQFVSFCTFTRTTGKQEKTWQKLTGTWSQAQYKGIGSGMGRFQFQGKAVQASSSAIRGWNKTCCNG